MSDHEDAARVLEEFVPIGNDDPRVQEFEQAVIEQIQRPSPVVLPPDPYEVRLERIEQLLREVIGLLRGGPT